VPQEQQPSMTISSNVLPSLPISHLVVITGDASCGKSRIVERYVTGKFSDKSQATIGVEFITKNVVMSDGNRVRLQIWDTGKPTYLD